MKNDVDLKTKELNHARFAVCRAIGELMAAAVSDDFGYSAQAREYCDYLDVRIGALISAVALLRHEAGRLTVRERAAKVVEQPAGPVTQADGDGAAR